MERWQCLAKLVPLAVLSACTSRAPFALPADPVERAATCGAMTWNDLARTDPPGRPAVASVLRVVHFTLLVPDDSGFYKPRLARAAGARIIALHRARNVFPEQARAACAQAFPASMIDVPVLPSTPLEGTLECATLIDYARARLKAIGMHALDARYGALRNRFAPEVDRWMRSAYLQNGVGTAWRNAALIAAAKLGQPAAVLNACEANFERIITAPPPPFTQGRS